MDSKSGKKLQGAAQENKLSGSRIRPLPNSYLGMFKRLCNGQCNGNFNCTFPHNLEELDAWNKERNPPPRRWNEVALRKPSAKQMETVERPLSRENYKPKFKALLYHENQSHIKILNDKCSDSYTIVLHQVGAKKPEWMKHQLGDTQYRRVGYLKMSGDRIAYAVQATRRYGAVSLMHNGSPVCSADILQENYNHTDERLYIALDSVNALKLSFAFPSNVYIEFQAYVKFELKHSYFSNLQDSVDRISDEMITKIVPSPTSFQNSIHADVSNYENICSPDQLDALKAIASCPSGPPVVITGPFGTGKSYLLAVATSYFFHESKDRRCSARILVCTQQRASADSFMTMYQTRKEEETLCIIRSYGSQDRDLKKLYCSVDDFRRFSSKAYCTQRNILAVTTCLTARILARFVPAGFFTHILIDEGAQMREPEAIAPLSMADPHTKIVIAGDQHQVGPAMLVLGEIPTKYGLSLSLLERLFDYYQSLGSSARSYYATLVTNFRSRNEILSLTRELFYETELTLSNNQEPPTHPDYPYPLKFICSSVNEDEVPMSINEKEAEIVADVVANIAKKWPSKLWGQQLIPSTLCIMSPNRAQLTVTNRCLENKKFSKLRDVKRHPTYDIQGREFRALFMSTSEPTNPDASSKDPLKSLTDPHVFNTAITRAQSLIVAVGNPFLLLKMEKHMVKRYNGKGKCWSSYLKRCLENGTVTVDPSSKLSDASTANCLTKLRQLTHLPAAHYTEMVSDNPPEMPQHPPLPSTPTFFAEKPKPSDGSDIAQRKVPQLATPLVSAEKLRLSNLHQSEAPHTPTPLVCDEKLRPPEAIPVVSQPKGSASLIDVAKMDYYRSKVNDFFTRKLISKPKFSVSGDKQTGFVCTLTFNINETCKQLTIETDNPMPTKARSREFAADRALEEYNPKIKNWEVKGPVSPIPARSISALSHFKQPLALLKELCDRKRLKYGLRMVESDAGDHFQFTVFVKNEDSPEIQFEAKGKPKKTKQEARHSAAKEAIAHLGGQWFEIEEPPSASIASKGSPNSSTQKETEGESVSSSAVARASPHEQGAGVSPRLRPRDEDYVLEKTIGQGGFGVVSKESPNSSTQKETEGESDSSSAVACASPHEQGAGVSPQLRPRLDEDYVLENNGKPIGQGGFGVVFHVKSKIDDHDYALKIIKLPAFSEDRKKVVQEARILADVTNDYILRYYTSWKEMAPVDWKDRDWWKPLESVTDTSSLTCTQPEIPTATDSEDVTFRDSSEIGTMTDTESEVPPTCLCIVTELCEDGTLRDWLKKNTKPNTREKKKVIKIFEEVLKALCYMHEESGKGYIHRDLKPSNIFFKDDKAKVGDFGLVKVYPNPTEKFPGTGTSKGGQNEQSDSLSLVGTQMYMSPEQLEAQHYGQKVDMFALGLILFELMFPMVTDSEKLEMFSNLRREPRGKFPRGFGEKIPNETAVIIDGLLKKDPTSRLSANDLLKSKLFISFKKKMESKNKSLYIPIIQN